MTSAETLAALLMRVRTCRICEAALPLGPRPVLRVRGSARLLIIGQAPGTNVHETPPPSHHPTAHQLPNSLAVDKETY